MFVAQLMQLWFYLTTWSTFWGGLQRSNFLIENGRPIIKYNICLAIPIFVGYYFRFVFLSCSNPTHGICIIGKVTWSFFPIIHAHRNQFSLMAIYNRSRWWELKILTDDAKNRQFELLVDTDRWRYWIRLETNLQ